MNERHDAWYKSKEIFRRLYWHPHLREKARSRKLYLLQNCKKYVLLSKQFIPEFCKFTGIKQSEKLTFINNPLEYDCIDEEKITAKENILAVCRLNAQKRVDKMIYIWKVVASQLSDWKFVIVGDGPDRTSLLEKVEKEGISRIEFVGYCDPTKTMNVQKSSG